MNNDLVSIIIPTYNRFDELKKAVKSCFNNKNNIEVIIINDCSSDPEYKNINKYYSSYSNIKVINNDINKGPALSRNIGFNNSNGKYITLLDDDDLLHSSYISECLSIIDNYDFIIPNYLLINETSNKIINVFNNLIFIFRDNYIEIDDHKYVAEDVYWKIKLFKKYKNIGLAHKAFYFYSNYFISDRDSRYINNFNNKKEYIKLFNYFIENYDEIDQINLQEYKKYHLLSYTKEPYKLWSII
jgi:glycosyltransferase involved in cell wall biosynthesis